LEEKKSIDAHKNSGDKTSPDSMTNALSTFEGRLEHAKGVSQGRQGHDGQKQERYSKIPYNLLSNILEKMSAR
jgi:hypothetical protein